MGTTRFVERNIAGDARFGLAHRLDAATIDREPRALIEAGKLFPRARKRLLTLTPESIRATIPADVVVQPAYEWFLSAPPPASTRELG